MDERNYRILLVSDHARGAEALHEALKRAPQHIDVLPVQGVDAAVERLRTGEYDSILAELDGGAEHREGALENLLRHAGPVPVVVLAAPESSWRLRALQLGAWDCLVEQGLDLDTLLTVVAAGVEHREAERALRESEARYRRLLESVTDYVYMVRIENGRPVASSHSPSCSMVTGYTSEEYAADPYLWYHMVHEEDRQAVLDMTAKVAAGETPPPLEHRIIHKNGGIRWIKNTPVPRRDPSGNLTGYDGLVTDITGRKLAEQELLRVNKALRESEEKLRWELENSSRAKKEWEVTFDAISNPLFIHDREFRIMRANRAYCEAAGRTFMEILGQPYFTVFPKMNGPFRNCNAAVGSDGGKLPIPDEEISVAECKKIFRAKYYPVHNDSGDYLCSVHILEDITGMKLIEENMKQEMEMTSNLLLIAEATTYTMDIDKLMEETARCGRSVLGCDVSLTYLWKGERHAFLPSQQRGLAHELIPLFRTESLEGGAEFIKRLLALKKPVVVRRPGSGRSAVAAPLWSAGDDGPAAFPTATASWVNDEMKTLIVIPLIGKTDLLGLIIGVYRSEKSFTERDRKIVEGLSRQISLALDEAQLSRTAMERSLELNNKIETLQVIHEIDRSILSSLEPREILETTARNIYRVVPCDRAGILLVDRRREGFIQATGNGTPGDGGQGLVPFTDTSATEVLRTARPQFIGSKEEGDGLLLQEKKLRDEGLLSHIRVPLIVKGEPIGVLGVDSRRKAAFTPEHLSTLEKLAAQIGVALENTRLVTDMQELLLGTVKSLSNAIDAKSPWTAGHSERVTRYVLTIARKMHIEEGELKDLELGSLLHDVGKIGINDGILNKPGELTREEFELVKKHPLKGVALLEPIKRLDRVIPCIRHHHERFDGTGYPDGLRGERIPLWARILAVADAFDSMTVERPYRKAFSTEEALAELKRCSLSQFDPEITSLFVDIIRNRTVSDRRGLAQRHVAASV